MPNTATAAATGSERKGAGYRQVLAIRDYRMLFCSQLVSDLGDGVYKLALIWGMKVLTGSALQMSLILAANLIPTMVIGLISGVIVDRGDKKRFMILSDVARGVIMLLVAVFWMLGAMQPWMLIAATALLSCFSAFFTPARTVTNRYVVPDEMLTHSQSLSTALQTVVGLSAPAIAGMLLIWDLSYAFLFNAATFFLSLVFVYLIRNEQMREKLDKQLSIRSIKEGLKEGYQAIVSDTVLRALIIYVFLLNLVLSPIAIMLPLFVDEISTLGASALAVLEVASFIGLFLGSLLVGYLTRFKRMAVTCFGMSIMVLCFVGLSFAPNLTISALLMFLFGVGGSLCNIPLQTLFLIKVPMPVLGRASSMMRILSMSSSPISYLLIGAFLFLIDLRVAFLAIGLISAVLVAMIVFNKNMFKE